MWIELIHGLADVFNSGFLLVIGNYDIIHISSVENHVFGFQPVLNP
jgi:hypothetical protein